MEEHEKRKSKWHGLARVGIFAAIWATILILVVIVALLLPPVRGALLRTGVGLADGALPGHLVVGRAAWPGLGTIELAGVSWTDDADTLVTVDRVEVAVALQPLFARDVHVRHALVRNAYVDVPAILARFPAGSGDAKNDDGGGSDFPREGALPGIPSIAADDVSLSARAVVIGDSAAVRDVAVTAAVSLLAGENPAVKMFGVRATGPGDTWAVDTLSLEVDIAAGRFGGLGRGRLMPGAPFDLKLTTSAADSFSLQVGLVPEGLDAVTVTARGRIDHVGLEVRRVRGDADLHIPGTRDLAAYPLADSLVAGLPEVEAVDLRVRADARLRPDLHVEANVASEPNPWLQEISGRLSYSTGTTKVEDLRVAMPGIELGGAATTDGGAVTADAKVSVTDGRWISIFAPDASLPDPLRADIALHAERPAAGETLVANINADGRSGGFTLDRLALELRLDADATRPVNARVAARALGLDVDFAGEVERGEDITVHLSPIIIREAGRAAEVPDERGAVLYASDGSLKVRDVSVNGTAGAVRINATLDSTKAGDASAVIEWAKPPTALFHLAGINGETVDSLVTGWQRDAPYQLSVGASLGGDVRATRFEAEFKLLGPRDLATFLPDSARVEDLGPLAGVLELTQVPGDTARMDARLDLTRTAWIDTSSIHIDRAGSRTSLDSIVVSCFGLTIGASGTVSDDLDLLAWLHLASGHDLGRFVGGLPDMGLDVTGVVTGKPDAPVADVTFEGSIQNDAYEVPRFLGQCTYDGRVDLTLRAPAGFRAGEVHMDSLSLAAASEGNAGGVVPLRMRLETAGEQLAFFNELVVDTTGGVNARIDSLVMVMGKADLRTRGPFSVGTRRNPAGVFIDGLELAGGLGHVSASGFVAADTVGLRADVELTLPGAPPSLGIPEDLWPDDMKLQLDATGPKDASASLLLHGFVIGDGQQPQLELHARARDDSLRLDATLTESDVTYLEMSGALPVVMTVYPPKAGLRTGAIDAHLELEQFPLAVALLRNLERGGETPEGEVARVNGTLDLSGTTDNPTGTLALETSFPEWPKMSAYRLALDAGVGPGDSLGTAVGGMEGRLRLVRDGRVVLKGEARYPGRVALYPFAFAVAGGDLHYDVRADSLALEEFDPLLPLDMALKGILTLGLRGGGDVRRPSIEGDLSARDLTVSVAQRARVTAHTRMTVSGDLAAPVVKGAIDIQRGLIRIPDLPPNLHATKGEAILLEDSLGAVVRDDSSQAHRGERSKEKPAGRRPEFDVSVNIPGAFWIRGKGLDLELAGNLRIVQEQGTPTILGELRAVRGTLTLLGRKLTLEEGEVVFSGGDEINPSLSVTLSTRIDEYTIRILFGGTVQDPKVFLSSSPEMEEGDIMAVLLFGKPLDQLDDDQANHMQKRSAEVAVALGAAELQKEMSGQLGVDVFSYEAGETEEGKGAFTFGKYLSPQVLLSYVRSLDDVDDSYISLEYFLRGRFKIQSIHGKKQSGIGVGWAKDY